jgi:hypothetical protein
VVEKRPLSWYFLSGRRDLNPRPLDPQAQKIGRSWSMEVDRGASHLRKRPGGVVAGPGESDHGGSPIGSPRLLPNSRGHRANKIILWAC